MSTSRRLNAPCCRLLTSGTRRRPVDHRHRIRETVQRVSPENRVLVDQRIRLGPVRLQPLRRHVERLGERRKPSVRRIAAPRYASSRRSLLLRERFERPSISAQSWTIALATSSVGIAGSVARVERGLAEQAERVERRQQRRVLEVLPARLIRGDGLEQRLAVPAGLMRQDPAAVTTRRTRRNETRTTRSRRRLAQTVRRADSIDFAQSPKPKVGSQPDNPVSLCTGNRLRTATLGSASTMSDGHVVRRPGGQRRRISPSTAAPDVLVLQPGPDALLRHRARQAVRAQQETVAGMHPVAIHVERQASASPPTARVMALRIRRRPTPPIPPGCGRASAAPAAPSRQR